MLHRIRRAQRGPAQPDPSPPDGAGAMGAQRGAAGRPAPTRGAPGAPAPAPVGAVPATPARVRWALTAALGAAALATVVAAVLLWPPHAHPPAPAGLATTVTPVRGTVVLVRTYACASIGSEVPSSLPAPAATECQTAQVLVQSGPDRGRIVSVDQLGQAGLPQLHAGDRILLVRGSAGTGTATYGFYDFQRSRPLALIALAFAVIVIAVGRWRGVGALVGLGITWLVMVKFVLPAVLEGKDPLSVSIVGAALIVLIVLFVAHGVSVRTATAVLGTLMSLVLVDVIAQLAVHAAALTGLATEEAQYLQSVVGDVRVQGLLLGGVVIGALGVLNDVTVTQASAVWEIHSADPQVRPLSLYRSGMRVGRDHIASTVYTLVLAYAGAALPSLLLFTLAGQRLGQLVTSETIAEEVVRTLVGSIGLVAAVPLTTLLAAAVVTRAPAHAPDTPGPAG